MEVLVNRIEDSRAPEQPSRSGRVQLLKMPIQSLNPATAELLRTFPALSPSDLEEKLALSAQAAALQRRTGFAERASKMSHAAKILEQEKEHLGKLITTEMGKTLRAATDEVLKCAAGCRYYAENAESFMRDEEIPSNATRSFVRYQPMGVILAIMPWNFPFWQVFRFAAPALMAGNVGLLKHASNVPQCALAIEDIFRRAGFEAGIFQTLLIEPGTVESLLEDSRVAAVTLTGSEAAGSNVASVAGRFIKKCVLELGGSDPFVVMPSADLDLAIETAVKARVVNNGQSCIAAKRFIVHDSIYEEFEKRFTDLVARLKVGDPMDPETAVGPLATERIRADLADQVQRAVASGARLLTGGKILNGPGFYFEPGVLADLPLTCGVYREELFGPVAMLFRAAGLRHAIALANDSAFGLGSAAWTRDESEQACFIQELQAGQVFINGMVASDPRLPFGGVKRSGFGRELGSFGLREFVNIKTVWSA